MKKKAPTAEAVAKGKIITLGITPAQGRKNIGMARKKSAAMDLKFERVTLKQSPR